MEEPTSTPPIPESGEPRYCPECGSRVADLATSCLMCGAQLDVEEEAPEEAPPPRFQIPWGGLIAGILTALAFISLVGWLVRAQIAGQSGTPTPTVSALAPQPSVLFSVGDRSSDPERSSVAGDRLPATGVDILRGQVPQRLVVARSPPRLKLACRAVPMAPVPGP